MTYSPLIPTDLPPPNVAVNQLRTNFAQYATIFAKNHVAINDSNQGKHSTVIFQGQAVDPGVDNSFDAIYGKSVVSASGTNQQIFTQIPQFLPNDQPNLPMQLTFNVVNVAGPQYQTFLPGGYVMYFGIAAVVTLGVAIPITINPISSGLILALANANNLFSVVTNQPDDVATAVTGANTFTITSALAIAGHTFSWVAIAIQ
jgi:hypothetical protein